MKRLLFFICTMLCANVLWAQWFSEGGLYYAITGAGAVEVYGCYYGSTSVNIPSTVTHTWGHYEADEDGESEFITDSIGTYAVTSIDDWAFEDCSSLTSVTIPNSVTSIGNSAFATCRSLTSITIPNSVTSIGNRAFRNCSSLTSIDIPNSVTSIGDSAFEYCSSLTSVTCLAETAPSLGSYVFSSTPSTKVLNITCGYESEYTDWQNATTWASIDCFVPIGGLFTIGDLTYEVTSETEVKVQACTESATVVIPETVTYQGTTYDVTSIGNGAFFECSNLTSVTIPNSVTSIASCAFNGCPFLQNVTCLATTPPTLADNTVFPYPNIATLTVPYGTLEAYSASTSLWNMFFADRIEEDRNNEGGDSGLEDVEDTELSFYPNPTNSKITFSSTIERIEVIDLTGRCVLTFSNAREINIESLPAGAYYLRLTNNDKAIMRKVIKE